MDQRILVLLERCRAGDSTDAERAELARWVGADPSRQAVVDAYTRALDELGAPPGASPDARAAIGRINARIDAATTAGGRRRPGPSRAPTIGRDASLAWVGPTGGQSRRAVVWSAWRIAAVALLTTGGLTGWWAWRSTNVAPMREYASAPAQRRTVVLPDGSRLLLGPATRVRTAADFGRPSRRVELDGEAMFTVVHDPRHPFEVKTAYTTVRDVGTTFTVRAYPGDADSRVTVVEGEVALGGASLRARDLAVIDTAGAITVHRGVDVASEMAWTQGRLVFDRTPLRDVARELGRLYDVDVTIADSTLMPKLVKGSFTNESVDDVLRAVTFVVGARYDRTGRTVVIRRATVPSRTPSIPTNRTST